MARAGSDFWTGVVDSIAQIPDPETARSNLQSAFVAFREIPIKCLHGWVASSTSACLSRCPDMFGLFVEISVTEFSRWLLEEPDSRLDAFIDFLAMAMETDRRVDFVSFFASLVPRLLEGWEHVDINFLLAIQAPVFGYCVSGRPDARDICERWFHALAASKGAEIFGDDLETALAYFKIMNHAFLQLSITTATGLTQDPVLVAAQDATHAAIIDITQALEP